MLYHKASTLALYSSIICFIILDGTFDGNTTACPMIDPVATQPCPPACSSTTFGVDLSQLQLSIAGIDINTTELQARYLDAINIATRVSSDDMNYYLGQLQSINENKIVLKQTLTLGIVSPDKSTFKTLYVAVNEFADDMQNDVEGFSDLLAGYETAYYQKLSFYVAEFNSQLNSFVVALTRYTMDAVEVLPNMFFLNSSMNKTINEFVNVYEDYLAHFYTIVRTQNLTMPLDTTGSTNIDGVRCSLTMGNFGNAIYSMWPHVKYSQISKYAIDSILGNTTAFSNCQTQYGTFLATVRRWVDGVNLNQTVSPSELLQTLPQLASLDDIITQFTTNQISIVYFAANLTDAFATEQAALATIQSVLQTAGESFNSTADSSLASISDSIQQLVIYTNILSQYSKDDKITTFARNLKVWMNPQPQITSSQVCWRTA